MTDKPVDPAEGSIDVAEEPVDEAEEPVDEADEPVNGADEPQDPADIGERDAPPVEEAPYKVVFEANRCIAAGRCAEVSTNWTMDVSTGIARPEVYFFDESDLEHNVRAAEVCPAKKDRGVIHVVDRRTDEEIAPDPAGDGTLSVDW